MLLYSRELPGGGLVMIEGMSDSPSSYHGCIRVERRADPKRRIGHEPPIIAEVSTGSQTSAFRMLYDVASDNVAIARGLIKWQSKRRANNS
jgi:hypothetical protein